MLVSLYSMILLFLCNNLFVKKLFVFASLINIKLLNYPSSHIDDVGKKRFNLGTRTAHGVSRQGTYFNALMLVI